MKVSYQLIAKKITKLQKENGVSSSELAKGLGVSPSTISNIQRQSRYPSMDLLCKIASFFEIPVYYLFEESLEFHQEEIKKTVLMAIEMKEYDIASISRETGINEIELNDFLLGEGSLNLNQISMILEVLKYKINIVEVFLKRYYKPVLNSLRMLGLDQQNIHSIEKYIYSQIEIGGNHEKSPRN